MLNNLVSLVYTSQFVVYIFLRQAYNNHSVHRRNENDLKSFPTAARLMDTLSFILCFVSGAWSTQNEIWTGIKQMAENTIASR